MTKECYRVRNFTRPIRKLIDQCNVIIEQYEAQGYRMTLRQLYYQLVSRDVIPNTLRSYNRLSETVNAARLAGEIDWDAIEDRTRALHGTHHLSQPEDAILSAALTYRIDKWDDQKNRVEIWYEKDALQGVFARVCAELDIDHFSCRGYTSQTAMKDAADRHLSYIKGGQTPVLLHFGDHDPSGIDMTRDVRERLEMLSWGEYIEVDRLALNMDQVHKYKPPPNPAKETDSRHAGYVKLYGPSSWELDALEPPVLAKLVEEAVKTVRNEELWLAAVAKENAEREALREMSDKYGEIVKVLHMLEHPHNRLEY